jgi:hypothetical protein
MIATNTQNPLTGNSAYDNGTRSPVGSPFLSGSYSGCDAKIVVHIPINNTNGQLEIQNLKNRLTELDQEYYDFRVSPSRAQQIKELQGVITTKISNIQEAIASSSGAVMTKVLIEAQTMSLSVFRPKTPVRCLGAVYPRSFVRCSRTIAGTLIFTVFHKHVLQELLTAGLNPYSTGQVGRDYDFYHDTTMLPDQLPPLDVTMVFANEYGNTSYLTVWGLEFVSEGTTFSIEDLFSESTMQFVARDIDPIRDSLSRATDVNNGVLTDKFKPRTASQLRWEELQKDATAKRRNPYI